MIPLVNPIAPSSRRRAFTTIELMVTLAIIVIVAGIFVVGYRHVAGSTERRQTALLLEQMKNVLTEATLDPAGDKKLFELAFLAIYRDPTNTATADPNDMTKAWNAVPASSRDAINTTGRILLILSANPNVKKILDDLPIERKRRGSISITPSDPPRDVIVPLDAWGNPILFVYDNWRRPQAGGGSTLRVTPAGAQTGGLTDLYSDSNKGYWEMTLRPAVTDGGAYPYAKQFTSASPVRKGYTSVLGDALRSPDRRPFWVSAGPDGHFETHDDNVYSFEE